jgi:hypothetical protein
MAVERDDIDQREVELLASAAEGVRPVLREAAEAMRRLARDTDQSGVVGGNLYKNWMTLVTPYVKPDAPAAPPPEPEPEAKHGGGRDDDSPEARRARRK